MKKITIYYQYTILESVFSYIIDKFSVGLGVRVCFGIYSPFSVYMVFVKTCKLSSACVFFPRNLPEPSQPSFSHHRGLTKEHTSSVGTA